MLGLLIVIVHLYVYWLLVLLLTTMIYCRLNDRSKLPTYYHVITSCVGVYMDHLIWQTRKYLCSNISIRFIGIVFNSMMNLYVILP